MHHRPIVRDLAHVAAVLSYVIVRHMNISDISPIIKEKSPLILAEIKKAKSILLHCHPSPDPDSVGTALAMKFALEQLGKKATIIKGDSDIPAAFMHFPGARDIVQKNFGEILLEEFDLFISLDSSNLQMISGIKPPVFPESLAVVVIDHHVSNIGYGRVNLIDLTSPATAFILFQLFRSWDVKLTREIAANIFVGIYTDTGGLKYPPTDHRVFEAMSELVKIVPDFTKVIFDMDNSEIKESIYFEALALGSIETFLNDSMAIAVVSNASIKEKNIPIDSIHGYDISNKLKSVIGWNIGISMVEREPNIVKLSIRTRDSKKFDVSKLAVALGGGGHKAAAGAILKMPLDEAKVLVVSKAKELYNL